MHAADGTLHVWFMRWLEVTELRRLVIEPISWNKSSNSATALALRVAPTT